MIFFEFIYSKQKKNVYIRIHSYIFQKNNSFVYIGIHSYIFKKKQFIRIYSCFRYFYHKYSKYDFSAPMGLKFAIFSVCGQDYIYINMCTHAYGTLLVKIIQSQIPPLDLIVAYPKTRPSQLEPLCCHRGYGDLDLSANDSSSWYCVEEPVHVS